MTVYFTKEHEWVRVEGDTATVGISDHAQQALGDVVYVELPDVGQKIAKGEKAAVVESVKAASEVYAPAAGEVVERNEDLAETPALINEDAQGRAWFFKMRLDEPGEAGAGLMDEEAYKGFLESLD